MPNKLIDESSPYLLQHAQNPVDWYPWGPEALARAKQEDKPIFLSIGYAACHWCHVMAHESFENTETAGMMNRYFINIKVDREERPDLDSIYMQATVAMTGQGGWPMSVFLTPGGVPFYAGTYFPNTPRHGMPSFTSVLTSLADAWSNRRADIEHTTASLLDFYKQESRLLSTAQDTLKPEVGDAAFQALITGFDGRNGGWGRAPKFPQPMTLEFLLVHYIHSRNLAALSMAETTLMRMAHGGIYDQIGGGFHRYATDANWLVPHFEKMLYDNAQLARVYLHAWQVTGKPLYQKVVVEILDYVLREMTHPDGGFYSTQDADSEGVEGKYFVWTPDETRRILGDEAELFNDIYDVTKHGNFEGANILHPIRDLEEVSKANQLSTERLRVILEDTKRKLFVAREGRVKPGRDEKVLTAWNGLMLAAFAEAARVLDRADYRVAAERNAQFILRELRTSEGRLWRTWKAGIGAKLPGYLEDYTHLAEGLLSLYQATFDPRWFVAARELADQVLAHFKAADGTFYDTSDDHEALVSRPHDLQDNAVPAGNSMAATILLKLAAFTGETRYADSALRALSALQESFAKYPTAFGQWLVAFEFAIQPPREIAVVGETRDSSTQALLKAIFSGYRPAQVVALKNPGEASPVPLLHDREQIGGIATAYVCRQFVCQRPVNEAEALVELLK